MKNKEIEEMQIKYRNSLKAELINIIFLLQNQLKQLEQEKAIAVEALEKISDMHLNEIPRINCGTIISLMENPFAKVATQALAKLREAE